MPLNPESDCERCRTDEGSTCTCRGYCGSIVCLADFENAPTVTMDEVRAMTDKLTLARMDPDNQPPYTCHERGETRTHWSPHGDGLEECVQFTPGFNCHNRTMNGHGVHGMEIWWLLRGPMGAAQFLMYTEWIPGKLEPGHGLSPDGISLRIDHKGEPMYPMGADLGYHARRPQYEGHESISDDCVIISGPCYYDGASMRAHDLAREFVVGGESVIWKALEDIYADLVISEYDVREE